jgi:hypothetical protein
MNKLLTRFVSTGLILLALVAVTATSCKKNQPCKAVITVLDPNDAPVSGMIVRLEPQGTNTIAPIESTTDLSGKVNFETELPKILDVVLEDASGTIYPTGKVVRFEEGKTDEVTVKM